VNLSDTIIACASGTGRSARALVRVSGGGVGAVVDSLFTDAPIGAGASAARLRLDRRADLPVLLSRFVAPKSYTGEDSLELQLPGNPVLVDRAVSAVCALDGVRLAQPGEFTARAYLNRRMTLDQAEGVAAIISAGTREQLDAARSLLSGSTGGEYRAMADECATLLALVEAGIDFTDQEDVIAIDAATLRERLGALRNRIAGHLGAASAAEVRTSLSRVAIVGAPNTGKSTLFNALLGRKRAIESPIRGTTRDVLSEVLDLSREVAAGPQVELQDLPGLDPDATGKIDEAAQRAALDAAMAADVVMLCDPRAGASSLDLRDRPVIRVRTWGDRPAPASADPAYIPVCALDGWNLGVLRREIASAVVSSARGASSASVAAVLPRHRAALLGALACLAGAESAVARDAPSRGPSRPEVVAGHLREALDALGELVGRITPDDVLGRVFATFCIGK